MIRYRQLIGMMTKAASGPDTDATAFFTAAGITDTTQKSAVDTFVKSCKSAGIWTKIKAVYPFVGGTATTHKYNLKDPQDTNGAFRLSFSGTWVHSSNGAKANASGAFADTFLVPTTAFADNNFSIGLKASVDASSNGTFGMGCSTAGAGIIAGIKFNTNGPSSFVNYLNVGSGASVQVNTTNRLEFIQAISEHGVERRNYHNSTGATATATVSTRPAVSMYLGNLNVNGSADIFCNCTLAFAYVATLLTDAEALALNSAVQAMQTTLGR